MAADDLDGCIAFLCCGLPIMIFLIANFGVSLTGEFFILSSALEVILIGFLFTFLGVLVLGKLADTDKNGWDKGSIVVCCGVPLLLVIIYSMAMAPIGFIGSVFCVVVVGFIIILLGSALK